MLEEDLQRVDERARCCLTRGTARISTCGSHILLDGVDLRNAGNRFGGDGVHYRAGRSQRTRAAGGSQKATVIRSAFSFL
jgi:hypothetical protein